MLTDDQLAARIGPRLRAELDGLPAPDLLAALRRRRARRARVTATLAALPVAAAAAAAAVFLPGPAAPAAPRAQDAAYVVSHVTRALDAVPADTVLHMHSISESIASASKPYSIVTDIWWRGPDMRVEAFQAGKPVSDAGSVTTGTTQASVFVDYRDRTWWRSSEAGAGNSGSGAASAKYACDSPDAFGDDPGIMAAQLRAWVSCGALKAGGTATIGGVTAIELTSAQDGSITTWYVNSSTYLPFRMTRTNTAGSHLQQDFQWLPPTTANLAELNLPSVPQGFTRTPSQ